MTGVNAYIEVVSDPIIRNEIIHDPKILNTTAQALHLNHTATVLDNSQVVELPKTEQPLIDVHDEIHKDFENRIDDLNKDLNQIKSRLRKCTEDLAKRKKSYQCEIKSPVCLSLEEMETAFYFSLMKDDLKLDSFFNNFENLAYARKSYFFNRIFNSNSFFDFVKLNPEKIVTLLTDQTPMFRQFVLKRLNVCESSSSLLSGSIVRLSCSENCLLNIGQCPKSMDLGLRRSPILTCPNGIEEVGQVMETNVTNT